VKPNDSGMHFHFGSYTCVKVANVLEPWLERQISIKLSPRDTIRKVLKHRFLWCPRFVHLWVMIKRRGKSQKKGNLTLDHKSLESKGQMKSN